MPQCILLSAGVDYLTLTSTSAKTLRQMREYYNEIALEDLSLGYKPRKVGVLGFYGEQTRHAFLGEREGRFMLRVSGERAQDTIMLCNQGDSCTRLDIQVTVRLAPGVVNRWLDACEHIANTWPLPVGKRPKVKAEHGEEGNETVYIGKRASDIFIRCYDKFRESGREEYRDAVRLEVELKGKTSKRIWEHCASEGLGSAFLVEVLFFYLNRRGISTYWIDVNWSYVRPPTLEKSSLDVTVGWIATQVNAAIKRVCKERRWVDVFRVAFEGALTQHDMSAIIRWGNVVYGD